MSRLIILTVGPVPVIVLHGKNRPTYLAPFVMSPCRRTQPVVPTRLPRPQPPLLRLQDKHDKFEIPTAASQNDLGATTTTRRLLRQRLFGRTRQSRPRIDNPCFRRIVKGIHMFRRRKQQQQVDDSRNRGRFARRPPWKILLLFLLSIVITILVMTAVEATMLLYPPDDGCSSRQMML